MKLFLIKVDSIHDGKILKDYIFAESFLDAVRIYLNTYPSAEINSMKSVKNHSVFVQKVNNK